MTDDLVKFLRTSTSSAYNKTAADRIEELEKQCSVYARSDWFLVEEIKELEAKLTKAKELVEQAFCEGFTDGHGGGYADSDSYPAWMRSYALAELEGKE